MKIVFFSDTFYPAHNGILSAIINYANGLTVLGHQVLICAPFHPKASKVEWFLDERVEVFLAPSLPMFFYPDFRMMLPSPSLFKKLHEFQPDVIHTHYVFTAGLIGLLYGKWKHIPLVATCNTQFTLRDSLKFFKVHHLPLSHFFHDLSLKYIFTFFRKHDRVLAISQSIQNLLLRQDIPANIVPIPIPNHHIMVAKTKGLQLKKDRKIKQGLIYIGRVSEEKNLDRVVKMFAVLHEKLPQLSLIIVGDGPDMHRIRKQVIGAGLEDKVIFWGAVPYETLFTEGLFYLGDVFITMSEFEAQGLSTVEALASGLPVIAAQNDVNEEVVAEGGILVPYPEWEKSLSTILTLFTNKKKYAAVSRRALLSAERYRADTCSQQLIDHYQQLIIQR